MGCCGARGCADSSDTQDQGGNIRTPAVMTGKPIDSPPHPEAVQQAISPCTENEDAGPTRQRRDTLNAADSTRPRRVTLSPAEVHDCYAPHNIPYGGPDDEGLGWRHPSEGTYVSDEDELGWRDLTDVPVLEGDEGHVIDAGEQPASEICKTPYRTSASVVERRRSYLSDSSSSSSDWEDRLARLNAKEKEGEHAGQEKQAQKEKWESDSKRVCPQPAACHDVSEEGSTQSAGAGAAVAQAPRRHLAHPEQGDPLQCLPISACPTQSAAAGVSAMQEAPEVQPTGDATPHHSHSASAAAPEKVSLLSWLKQKATKGIPSVPAARAPRQKGLLSAGVARAQKLAPEPRRFAAGGLRESAAKTTKPTPRPAIVPVGPRKPFKSRPVRPARPGNLACPTASIPQLHSASPRPVPKAQCGSPQAATKCAAQPPRAHDASPQVGGELLGSQPGSTVEGTSPGHSPLPEYAPVLYSVAPERSSLPWLGAAHQDVGLCGDDYGYASPRAVSGYAHGGSGGFREMAPGEEINGCKVERFLGRGAFGEVWLATSRRSGAVAVKVSRSGADYHKEAQFERQALAAIDTFACQSKRQLRLYRGRIVRMKTFFKIPGTGGAQHPCMVLEPLGPSILELAEKHDGRCVSPDIVKVLMRQLLQALAFLAEMQMAHGDLKPENILLTARCQQGTATSKCASRGTDLLKGKYRPPCQGESLSQSLMRQYAIKLIDFGKAVFCRYEEVLDPIQTLQYRAPEVVCGSLKLTPAIDTWSAGCICSELLTGDYLFDIDVAGRDELTLHPELWSWWIATLGDPPRSFTRSGAFPLVEDFFDPYGCLKEQTRVRSRTLSARLKEKGAAKGQSQALVHLLPLVGGMLQYCPEDRSTPQEALMSSWLRF